MYRKHDRPLHLDTLYAVLVFGRLLHDGILIFRLLVNVTSTAPSLQSTTGLLLVYNLSL